MATATKKKKAAKKKTGHKPGSGTVIQFPLKCKKVSIGDKTISIGVTISRENCTLARADQCLVARRLTAVLKLGAVAAAESPQQKTLGDMDETTTEVRAVIQTAGISVKSESIGATLNFNKKEVAVGLLDEFANREAGLVIEAVDEIPDDELDPDPAEEAEDDGGDDE